MAHEMTERLKILSKYSFPEKPSYGSNKCDKRKHYFSINHIWKHTKGCRKELYFYTMSAQMKTLIDRCCARYTEITNKNFYFIVTAAEPSIPAMERTIDGFRGFLDCLEGAREKGIIYGTGVWKIGEIEGKPILKEAYEIGEKI